MSKVLGDKILEYLKKMNLTQRELAEKVCVQETTISRYISGDRE